MNKDEFLNSITPAGYLIPMDYDFDNRMESLLTIAGIVCPGFILDEYNFDLYQNGIKYFAGDASCQWSLNKGLFIHGGVGVGKSVFFRVFMALNKANLSKNWFRIISVNSLIDGVSEKGILYFKKSGISPETTRRAIEALPDFDEGRAFHLCLDDLGQSERVVMFYGTPVDVMANFIQRRYYAYSDCNVLTHMATNLTPNLIKDEYSAFIASRMREMFNIIEFKGKDRRK